MEISPMLVWLNLLLAASMVVPPVLGATDVYTQALLTLKSELVDHYNGLGDWFMPSRKIPSEEIAACSWTGVSCNDNSTIVVGLDLSRKSLSGQISGRQLEAFVDLVSLNLSHNLFSGPLPVSIFNLTNLRKLDISRNNFSGRFPAGVSILKKLAVLDAFSNSFSGPLPAEVSQIESLQVLNFAGSYFSGPIPAEYGDFRSLEFIHLAGNFLNGEIPPQLGKLQTMSHMEIGYNSYLGGIPWQLANMTQLRYLDIADANLSGPIPKQLSNLTKLESLFLFRNQLSGSIPSEFSNLLSLRSLDLSDNLILGRIPESFSDLKNLTLLSLMYNQMTGTVPQAIADLPMLETLLIWSNFFSGPLPWSLGINSQLTLVDVSSNNLSGSIPPNLCANGVLSKLILFSNSFTGQLPLSLSNCSSLVRIRFEDNLLSGPISLNFSSLSNISYVDLSRNKFTGGVPGDIIQASKLEYFNVSGNSELGGNLPPGVWSLPLLQNFSASSCNISGSIPSFLSCTSLSVIELSSNALSGYIPETVSDCQGLSVIDISKNNLSGSIPEKLGHSSSLQLLNVSFNDISGSIPQDNTFRSMGRSAFTGNPRLCGLPLHPCSNSMEFLWVLTLCIAVVAFVALAVSGVFYIQKGRKRSQWKMVSFSGLPKLTAGDILRSFNSAESTEALPCPLASSQMSKITLPTGVTVAVKKIEWDSDRMKVVEECIIQMGNARHKNLTRLLGYCHNRELVYLLYEYLPNNGTLVDKIAAKQDWSSKYKTVMGIAEGLRFLHHECYPPIPHGDLRATNILVDQKMEPRLAEFGFRFLMQLNKASFPSTASKMQQAGDQLNASIQEELYTDIYNFGEVVLEMLSNGRIKKVSKGVQNKPRESLIEDIHSENEVGPEDDARKEINLAVEVALLCTKSRSSERPSMEDVLKLLSASK